MKSLNDRNEAAPDLADRSDPGRDPGRYPGRGRVLRVKEGYNPNSSSLGSVIFSIPAALVAAPLLLSGAAALIASRLIKKNATQDSADKQPAPESGEGEA